VSSEGAAEVVKDLTAKIEDKAFIGSKIGGMYFILSLCSDTNCITRSHGG
jgi:hypothetical protein